jgi:hypothetical protein
MQTSGEDGPPKDGPPNDGPPNDGPPLEGPPLGDTARAGERFPGSGYWPRHGARLGLPGPAADFGRRLRAAYESGCCDPGPAADFAPPTNGVAAGAALKA